MLEIFAAVSLLIAMLGQYAVLAFAMKRRVREFGLRMALGASATQILGSVVGEGLRLTIAGLAIGVALSLAAARALRSMLFGVSPRIRPPMAASSWSLRRHRCWHAGSPRGERHASIRSRPCERNDARLSCCVRTSATLWPTSCNALL